jgi:hypothetical protein
VANEDETLLREVDRELAEERQWTMFRKHGLALAVAAFAVIGGVAGWQAWTHLKITAAEKQALEFRNAVELLETDREAGRAALDALAQEDSGYGALAALRRAASYSAGGERLKALEIYRTISKGGAPKRVRELAQLRAAYLALADGRDAVMADLGGLAEDKGPFGYYAKELLGIASLQAEDYESASVTFAALSEDANAPAGVRDRAEELAALAASAKAGVNITGEARVEDLLKAVGAAAPGDAAANVDGEPAQEAGEEPVIEENLADDGDDDHDDHNHEE